MFLLQIENTIILYSDVQGHVVLANLLSSIYFSNSGVICISWKFYTPLLSIEFIHLFRFAVGMSTKTYSSSQVVFVVSRTSSVGRVSPRVLHFTKI